MTRTLSRQVKDMPTTLRGLQEVSAQPGGGPSKQGRNDSTDAEGGLAERGEQPGGSRCWGPGQPAGSQTSIPKAPNRSLGPAPKNLPPLPGWSFTLDSFSKALKAKMQIHREEILEKIFTTLIISKRRREAAFFSFLFFSFFKILFIYS